MVITLCVSSQFPFCRPSVSSACQQNNWTVTFHHIVFHYLLMVNDAFKIMLFSFFPIVTEL